MFIFFRSSLERKARWGVKLKASNCPVKWSYRLDIFLDTFTQSMTIIQFLEVDSTIRHPPFWILLYQWRHFLAPKTDKESFPVPAPMISIGTIDFTSIHEELLLLTSWNNQINRILTASRHEALTSSSPHANKMLKTSVSVEIKILSNGHSKAFLCYSVHSIRNTR